MDDFNSYQIKMEDETIEMFSQVGHKFTLNAEHLLCPRGGHKQYSHTKAMDWEGKVAISEDQNMDCCESDVDVSIAKAKVSSQNLRLKSQMPKVMEPMPEPDRNMSFENGMSSHYVSDIDKRLALKKVAQLPAETKDDRVETYDHLLGYQHKKRSQKRTMIELFDEGNPAHTLDNLKLTTTVDLLQKIKAGVAPEQKCISYNLKFSSIEKLEPVQNAQVNSGSFGDVVKVKDVVTQQNMVLKTVKKNERGKFELEENEVLVPIQLPDAENIAQFFGLAWSGQVLSFIMEDAGTSLRQLVLCKNFLKTLEEPNRIEKIMLDMLSGTSHLGRHGITHCDIKPENVCLDQETWTAKLVDFGSSKSSKDEMSYKGVTPEYLEPLANKFMYEFLVLKNKNCSQHRLGQKDDVYSVGLVGLFLIKRAHPMIEFFTGASDYPKEPRAALARRMEVVKKISELTEEQRLKLLDVPMSATMRELLLHILDLNRDRRWLALKAVTFLKERLGLSVQPPNKLSRQEPQPCHFQIENTSGFIDLRNKNSDQIVLKRNEKREFIQDHETPDYHHSPDPEQSMGFAFKGQAASSNVGRILMPAKLNMSLPQGGVGQTSAVANFPETLSPQQQCVRKAPVAPGLQFRAMKEEESNDYNDLVNSFKTKLSPEKPSHFVPDQVAQRFKIQHGKYEARQADVQKVVFPCEAGQAFLSPGSAGPTIAYPGSAGPTIVYPVQEAQHWAPAIHGLSGRLVKVVGEACSAAGPPAGTECSFGNVPDMDALFRPRDELARPKAKIARRSRSSRESRD